MQLGLCCISQEPRPVIGGPVDCFDNIFRQHDVDADVPRRLGGDFHEESHSIAALMALTENLTPPENPST